MENVAPFLAIGGFIAVVVFVLTLAAKQQKRAQENLHRLGADLGLAVLAAKKSWFGTKMPQLHGTFRGRTVRVFAYSTGSGKHRVHWCAVTAAAQNPGQFKLRISRENLFTRTGRVFGLDDVATGDKAFDEKFYVKSSDPGYVRAALIPEVRVEIVQAAQGGARGSIEAKGPEVKYAEQGSFSNRKICDRFPAVAKIVCDVAEIVEARRG